MNWQRTAFTILATVLLATSAHAQSPAAKPPSVGWAPDVCRLSSLPPAKKDPETGIRTLRHELDVDDDDKPDVLVVEHSAGSGFAGTEARLTLSHGKTVVEAQASFAFNTMIDQSLIPDGLLAPQMTKARELMEDALFGKTCPVPDPSLAWLLRRPRRLEWIDGPPVMPEAYAIVDRTSWPPSWVFYAGHTHGSMIVGVEKKPKLVDTAPGYRLLTTSHGVILTNVDGTRHAWLYVFAGGPTANKLRFPSIRSARFEGDGVVIEVGQLGPRSLRGTIRIRLPAGEVSERWRLSDRP